MTTGATGQLYGSSYTWDTGDWATEQAHLDTPAITQLQYMENVFAARAWYNLVPDQSHTFLTAGMGTYDSTQDDVLQSNYSTAALTPDGTLGMVYVPAATTITIDLGRMAGTVTARWYDPTTNTYQAAGSLTYASGGSQQFTTPGTHSDGASDWLLVLEASSVPDTSPPTAPTGLTVTSTTGTQVNLAWSSSSDNRGVSGYQVYRDGSLLGAASQTTYADSGLAPGSTHTYYVVAADYAGNVSGSSNTVSATTTVVSTTSTPAFVQLNSSTPQSAQTSVTMPFSAAQTAGNTNVIALSFYNTAATVGTVTDSSGNTYALAAPLTHSGTMYQAIYYAANIKSATAGGNQVTVTFSKAVQYPDIRIVEYSGLAATGTLDVTSSATSSNTAPSSGNVTTTSPTELLFAAGSTSGVFNAAGAGYTKRVITNPDGDIVEDRVVTTAGSYAATASQSGDCVMQIVAFRAAGS